MTATGGFSVGNRVLVVRPGLAVGQGAWPARVLGLGSGPQQMGLATGL